MNKLLIRFLKWFLKEVILEIGRDLTVKFFQELSPKKIKETFKNKKHRIVFLLDTIFHLGVFFYLSPNTPKINVALSFVSYFANKATIKEVIEEITRRKYSGFTNMFNGKAKIVNVSSNKALKTKTFTIYSFIPKDKITSRIKEIEHYFNMNAVIELDNNNHRLLKLIVGNGQLKETLDNSTLENKLVNILNSYKFNATYKKIITNDFFDLYYIDCNTDIKKILNKVDDISYKLGIDSNRLEIKVELGVFIFQIKKEEETIYYFSNYIDKVKISKKNILPVLIGIDQNTSTCIIEDIVNLKHCLIIGQNGTGKSSTLNSFIQSLMYFHGSTYTKFIMYDQKGTELSQYKHFNNTTYIKTIEDLLKSILKFEKIMEDRNILFDKENVKDIVKYNNKYPHKKIPFIFFVIDEFSVMMEKTMNFDKKIAKQINDKLVSAGNICRSTGGRIVISTQKPTGGQVDTGITSQLNTKITHKITKNDKKVLMIEEDVHKLKTGEFILETENYTTKCKGLYIDDESTTYNKVYEVLEKKYTSGGGN